MNDAGRPPLRGLILMGGASRRMGCDKALIEADDGRSWTRISADALTPWTGEPALVGAGPIPDDCAHLPHLNDAPGFFGPFAGLLGALRSDRDHAWLVLPCDCPEMTPEVIGTIAEARNKSDARTPPPESPALVYFAEPEGDLKNPLVALYEPGALALLEALTTHANPAPRLLLDEPSVQGVPFPAALAPTIRGANRPSELP